MSSRLEAQQRADQIRAFEQELARLRSAGVLELTAAQDQAVRAHYQGLLTAYAREFDTDLTTTTKQLSLGMRIASLVGAVSLGASAFFLFQRYWGLLAAPLQIALLVLAPLATLGATAAVAARDATGYFTRQIAMVGFVCFVLNLALVGEIFNITPSPLAFLPWGACALLLAYYAESRLLLASAIVCGIAWLGAQTGTWSGIYWLYFGERPENFFPAAALFIAAPVVMRHRRNADFPAVYRVLGLLTAFVPILILSNWGRASYLPWESGLVEGAYQVAGFLIFAITVAAGVRFRYPHVVNTGLTCFFLLLYTKFFDWWWDAMPKYLFFLVMGLTAAFFLLVLRRLRGAFNLRSNEVMS